MRPEVAAWTDIVRAAPQRPPAEVARAMRRRSAQLHEIAAALSVSVETVREWVRGVPMDVVRTGPHEPSCPCVSCLGRLGVLPAGGVR